MFAIYSPNLPEYAVAFHAVSLLGGTVTTMNPLYTVGEIGAQLDDAGARYLVTVGPFLEKARQVAAERGLRGGVRVRRGRGCDAVRRAARSGAGGSAGGRSTRAPTSWSCPTRAAPRACPRA